jgi:hypothetical protein
MAKVDLERKGRWAEGWPPKLVYTDLYHRFLESLFDSSGSLGQVRRTCPQKGKTNSCNNNLEDYKTSPNFELLYVANYACY